MVGLIFLLNSCITSFIPEPNENQEILVVEGLITDQPRVNTLKLSTTLPLGITYLVKPVKEYNVIITDNIGNTFSLIETDAGTYVTDPTKFWGIIGRSYTLHLSSNTGNNNHNYESYPMEMKPVPPIDSIYYVPQYKVITYTRGCADCTTRGTTQMPAYWNDDNL